MIDVQRIQQLHQETVERWHHQSIDNPYDEIWWIICKQHSFNFLLWHEEDIAQPDRLRCANCRSEADNRPLQPAAK